MNSPTRRAAVADAVRFESRVDKDALVLAVAVPEGHDEWIALPEGSKKAATTTDAATAPSSGAAECAVPGCAQPRKYRCVAKFEVGGCSLAHLKEVEAGLKA